MSTPAWITGVGCIAGDGDGPVPDALLAPVSELLPDKHARHIDRAGALAVCATARAVAQAGWDAGARDVGLAFGVDYGTYPANFAHQRRLCAEGARFASPAEFTVTLPNMTAAFVALAFGWRGPTTTVADGGVAPATALGIALDWIRAGTVERICVGTSEPVDPTLVSWLEVPPLRREPDRPECAVVWCCESEASARRRGARPLAILRGYGAATEPAAAAATACADAGVTAAPEAPPAPTSLWAESGILDALSAPRVAVFVGPPVQARAIVLEPAA